MIQLPQKIQKDFKRLLYTFQEKTFRPYQIKKTVEGVSFDFIIADLVAQDWYNPPAANIDSNGIWLEMRFLKEKIICPGEQIFECGIHHGSATILLSKWVGNEGKIIGFEIFPQNAKIARQNINLNQISNVTIEQKGLGKSAGKKSIFRKSNSSIKPEKTLSLGFIRNAIYGTEEVDIVSLDNYAKQAGYTPTLLKLDVEGYESEVLKGAYNILQSAPKLAIEIHTENLSRYNTSVKEIFDLIDIDRYQCWIQWDDWEMPVEYDKQQEITTRVHLFAIPKEN